MSTIDVATLREKTLAAQAGHEPSKSEVFAHLHLRFGYAICRFLSKGMDWDDAAGECALLLWGLIREYDPERCDNVEAFIGASWRQRAGGIVEDAIGDRNSTVPWDEAHSPATASVEDMVVWAEEREATRRAVADFHVDPVDMAAALEFFGASTWREGSGARRQFTPGHAAAEIYAKNGEPLTALQASRRVRSTIQQMRRSA